MRIRRSRFTSMKVPLTVLTGAAFVAFALVATGVPAAALPTGDRGLLGGADPTYDGVFRQSLGILGLGAAGVEPSPTSISWLLRQECSDGSFTAYRPDTTLPCTPTSADMAPQTDATAMAALALASTPSAAAQQSARRALDWLARVQLANGGWQYQGTDEANANSTGLAVLALRSQRPMSAAVRNGTRFLLSLARPCASGGGLPYQSGGPANALAAAQGAWALGARLPIEHGTLKRNPACTANPRDSIAHALTEGIMGTGLLPSSFGAGSDPAATAAAVIALNGMGVGQAAVTRAMRALAPHASAYAKPGAADPGGLGLLMLAADAAGRDPRRVGGVDMVAALRASERR